MDMQTDDLSIESVIRPLSRASRVLRDWHSSGSSLMATSDDPPGLQAIEGAIDAVQASLASSVTREDAERIIRQMTVAESCKLVAAVTERDALSLTLDGKVLPLAAVAIAANRHRTATAPPTPDQFLRDCVRARQIIETLLADLLYARTIMRRRQGWR